MSLSSSILCKKKKKSSGHLDGLPEDTKMENGRFWNEIQLFNSIFTILSTTITEPCDNCGVLNNQFLGYAG